jgi:hypothetical protein
LQCLENFWDGDGLVENGCEGSCPDLPMAKCTRPEKPGAAGFGMDVLHVFNFYDNFNS